MYWPTGPLVSTDNKHEHEHEHELGDVEGGSVPLGLISLIAQNLCFSLSSCYAVCKKSTELTPVNSHINSFINLTSANCRYDRMVVVSTGT